jgi:hypothetical protein
MNLTTSERTFVERHRIGILGVLDGRGLSKVEYRSLAKEQGKTLILGSPCRYAGHRLRTRSGHCAECDPRNIAFQNRYHAEQFVYIAGSLKGKLIKIGTTNDADQRQRSLRFEAHGGYRDWSMLYTAYAKEAGKVEQQIKDKLANFQTVRRYSKQDCTTDAIELFECSFSRAMQAFLSTNADYHFKARHVSNLEAYEFGGEADQ